MSLFIDFVRSCWGEIFDLYTRFTISVGNSVVSFFWVLCGFVVIGMLINTFWKGAGQ